MTRHLFLALLAVVALAGCGSDEPEAIAESVSEAREICGPDVGEVDNGTLVFTIGVDPDLPTSEHLAGAGCVLDVLGAPDDLYEQIGATSEADGQQTAEWGGVGAVWSYGASSQTLFLVVVDL